MKNKLLLGAMLLGTACLFTACDDDNDSNPVLIQPTEFTLNTPAYINETVNLASSGDLHLTWSQPKYTADNAPINATYEVQVSATGSYTTSYEEEQADESGEKVADYAIIDRTTTLCTYDLAAADLAKALQQVVKYTEDEVPQSLTAYIRVNAYVAEGTKKLNAIASNVINLGVQPYYIELKDAAPIMWYILGNNFGDGSWGTTNEGIGTKCFPFFLQSDYSYDKATGAGEIVYMNYFTTDGFKINPSNLGDWDHGFMSGGSANTAVYRNAEGDAGNIWVDPAGIYKVTINTGTNECTFEKQDITPTVYSSICITGSFCDWGDVAMTPVNMAGENHVWCYELTVAAGETAQIKFKIPGSWDTNWGYGSYDGEVNTCGKGTGGGANIGVTEGTWIVMFNDIDGTFSIIAKQQ